MRRMHIGVGVCVCVCRRMVCVCVCVCVCGVNAYVFWLSLGAHITNGLVCLAPNSMMASITKCVSRDNATCAMQTDAWDTERHRRKKEEEAGRRRMKEDEGG